ncbi:MAG TPA: flagellar hook capping FlgD N-terminal domain-containing protein [Steroidobacteraceae bacterium]|nr:flagellar hook capping FlgD N-terminal domain-containing protein [Steroidobacteraceae bacterium]
MSVDAIGLPATTTAATSTATSINQQDFLQILLTQLQFQDPLKPVDNEQFVAQLAQFSALEVSTEQSQKIDSLLTIEGADQAVALMGKTVQAGADQANAVGTVTAISFSTGEPLMTITTASSSVTDVKLSDVTLIQ